MIEDGLLTVVFKMMYWSSFDFFRIDCVEIFMTCLSFSIHMPNIVFVVMFLKRRTIFWSRILQSILQYAIVLHH